ncbi:hypothetical protein F2Q68_00004808 [Brassica cretica]|uniref:Uncharacterized protein n=1 Tax=Brassica cretica TaxID=69181 RepID=A0A8S9JCM8_BRACR|nr:hypothetical protein F2Q68_00004808 [Brassica cretica]
MNWSKLRIKFCDFDWIVPSQSCSASGPWFWVGRSVMFLVDCWLAGRFGGVTDGLSRASIDDIYRVDRILQCRGDYDSREVRSKTPTSAQPCLCKYRSGLAIDRQRETVIDRQPQAPIDPRAPLTYRVQMPKIDVARLNALRPQPKPSTNPPETTITHSDDVAEPMEVDKAPLGRTLRKRKRKVAKHLKREANEKEMEISKRKFSGFH